MSEEIIFVKPDWKYDSYTDFWQLVSLSGFQIIPLSELDLSQAGYYIVAPHNGEWGEVVKPQLTKRRRAHLIHWNLERPYGGTGGIVNKYATRQWELMRDRMFDEVWVSDMQLGNETGLRYVTLGSDESLGQPADDKEYWFTHMSAIVPRRSGIYSHFPEDKIGPNAWPPERDEVLKKSKFALNVHQDNYSYQEPLRFALFAAYGLPIVSEGLVASHPYWDNIITAPYTMLASKMQEVLAEDYSKYRDMGLRVRDRMTKEFRFKDMVVKAIEQSTGGWR